METQQHQSHTVKGKRTKRPRSASPAASTSSDAGGADTNTDRIALLEDQYLYSSPASSSTEEEEDMAYCLILLAQGHGKPPPLDSDDENCCRDETISSRKFFHVSTATANKAGFFVYECKTCNRSFPSFQALGGHRASHKKPKSDDDRKLCLTNPVVPIEDRDSDFDHSLLKKQNPNPDPNPPDFSIQLSKNKASSSSKAKVHECSICGSEFNSGQALGGHMRRHRANNNNQAMNCAVDEVKPFALDLNLPAPEDDSHHRQSKFQFPATQQALVFSAPALVDCYY